LGIVTKGDKVETKQKKYTTMGYPWMVTRTDENGEVITYKTKNYKDEEKVRDWYKVAFPRQRLIELVPLF